ncbi:MAG TPA: FtsQ-type POTRA domain-containing protein [Gemmatirosa sp.]|nr:FtsQ-type POTRA domain-containing protein [Gemmatirosa sp.]
MSAPVVAGDFSGSPRAAARGVRGAVPVGAPDVAARRARRARRLVGVGMATLAAGTLAAAPWWGPRALGRLAFFQVRRVELEGARYASASELVRRLGVDTTQSVWADLGPLRARLAAHPMVARAELSRRLPGTLVVRVVEKVPVALAPGRGGALAVYDALGAALPIEPHAQGGLDVPLLAARDTTLLRLLGALRADAPRLFARVSEARRVTPSRARPQGVDAVEYALTLVPPPRASTAAVTGAPALAPVTVRLSPDVTVGRLSDLLPVEDELARRRVRVAEIDLRFRDQVIARLQ